MTTRCPRMLIAMWCQPFTHKILGTCSLSPNSRSHDGAESTSTDRPQTPPRARDSQIWSSAGYTRYGICGRCRASFTSVMPGRIPRTAGCSPRRPTAAAGGARGRCSERTAHMAEPCVPAPAPTIRRRPSDRLPNTDGVRFRGCLLLCPEESLSVVRQRVGSLRSVNHWLTTGSARIYGQVVAVLQANCISPIGWR